MKDIHRQRMLEVADLIEAHDRFAYQWWTIVIGEDGKPNDNRVVAPDRLLEDCSTAGCIGGWTAALASMKLEFPYESFVNTGDIGQFSADYLGFDYYGSTAVFHGRMMAHLGWYETDAEAMENATATEAAKLLRGIAFGEYPLPSEDDPMWFDVDDDSEPLLATAMPTEHATYHHGLY